MKIIYHLITATLCAVILISCSPIAAPDGPVAVQPALPTPTLEPTFTPSPSPTHTPQPSPTSTPAEPTPTPTSQSSLAGRIFDQDTGQPIPEAQVSAGTASTTTDTDGRYTLSDLPPGQYVLSITHPDYDPGLSSIFTLARGQKQSQDLTLYKPDTSPYPADPMLTNPLDPDGAPTAADAERLAREQGLTGEVVDFQETRLRGEYLVNYKIGDDVRAAVAEIDHEVWALTDNTGRTWWIIKVCGNLASRLPERAPIATPAPKPLPPMAEVLVDGLVARECASEDCGDVGTIWLGERVQVFGCLAGGGWCEVGWSGGRGWCTGRSLRQLAVAEAVPVVEKVPPTATPRTPTVGEGKIAFVRDPYANADIYAINPNGSGLTRLTNHPGRDWSPAWSPDGQQIAFASNRDGPDPQNCGRIGSCIWGIYIVNADGSGLTRVTNREAVILAGLAWAPDGSQIAFGFSPGGLINIYVINVDGSGQTQLTNDLHGASLAPAWSPGKQITFYSLRDDGNQEIYVMNIDGSGQTRLTFDSSSDISPAWSPSGSRIAFVSGSQPRVDADWGVFVMNADGTGRRRLTDGSLGGSAPTWSPDGTHIAFARDGNIYIINVDGSDLRFLTEGGSPAWSR